MLRPLNMGKNERLAVAHARSWYRRDDECPHIGWGADILEAEKPLGGP